MATNGARIIIPTSVRLQVENQAKVMREIQDNLKNIFSDVDPSSSLGKGLLKLYDQIEVRQNKINNLLGKEFFSEKDYAKVASYIEQIQDAFLEIQRRTNRATPAQLGLNTEEIEKATKALEDFKRHIVSIKNVSAAQALEESNDALKQFISLSEKIGFDPGKNLQTNLGNMNRTLDSASGRLAELKVEADEATESLEATKQKLFSLKINSNIANGELNKRATANTNLATQFASVKTGTGGKRTKTNILEDYNKILESWIDTTTQKFSAEGEMFSDIFSNWLSIDKASLGNTAAEIVEGLKTALREQLVSGNSLNFAPVKEWTSRILAGNIGEMDQQYVHLASKAEEVAQNLSATQTEFDTASEHASNIQQQIQQAQELIEIINQKIKELTELKQNFEKKIDEDNAKELQQKKDDLTKANRRATAGAYQGAAENIKRGGTTAHDAVADYEARVEGRKLAEEAEREADNFKNNLKQSISHWLSAQMIITKIREGVYQAWQDIQGLDKAMTNIAVVTDMSVSDLWGKIDEYMAIAQEYGVTTQGVYEVSQLYYQQGLSTSEVMEATTETLKMARIAGMDYKDAADAMTVAIRAFKMEMSDAQVITDVYSKVAAVTASDSQELAIAMSKTASSAESVGSSFENTTAMLAVMIETTRESAQNLGSALKSIISRYGEMKTGLTVDSEGEAIDYNKVDTALQSVGISIKDAQGQFRDFDDVIFELSKKWDSLDKNTQRYIATIMAGNRQQSRFIALVDNWERLDEVSAAAYDSEDAGLLQYAKTLDSLETKLNALSTSFQQFYMNIINGDTFKGAIDLITKILNSFNKLGSLNTIFSAVTIVKGLKLTLTLVSNLLSSSFTKIYQNYKSIQEKMTLTAFAEAKKRADGQAKIETEGAEMTPTFNRRWKKKLYNKTNSTVAIGADIANLVGATFAGIGIAQAANGRDYGGNNTGAVRGAFSTTIGNTLSNAASGATIGSAIGSAIAPGVGTAIGAAAGAAITGIGTLIAETITSIIPTIEKVEQERYERYKAETEEKNIERAETKEEYNNLKTLIDKYESSEENKYNSNEDYSAWLDVNNALIEAYPELIGYIDAEGNAIADMTKATDILTSKMNAASEATNAYYKAKIAELEQEYKAVSSKVYNTGVIDAVLNDFLTKGSRFTTGTAHLVDKNNRGNLFTGYSATAEDIDAWLKSVGVEDIYDALWQISGIADKGIDKNITDTLLHFEVISKNEKGVYSLDADYAKFLSRNSILQERQTVLDTQAQSHINLLSKNTDLDDDIANIAGYTDLIVSYAQKFHNYTQQQIAELSIQDYDSLISEFTNFYKSLSTDNQNILKTLYENLNKYSAQDLDNLLLTDFNLQQDDAIYQLFLQKWFDTNYKTKYDYAKLIWQDDFEFDDYTTWLAKQKDSSNTEENRQKYAEEVGKKVGEMSGNLAHFVNTAADSTLEAYAGYLTKERSVIKNGGNAGAIAQKRLDYINQLIGTGLLDLIDEDLLPQFISLLFSDNAGTTDWAINLSKFISDNNVFADGGGLDLTPFLYENVNTQLENLKIEQGQVVDSIKNLFEKQSEGFTIQEAENLITKHGLDGDINDYFIVENGQLILKNYTDFVSLIVDKFNTTSQTLKDNITQAQQIVEDGWLNNAPIDSKIIGWAQDIANGKDIKEAIAQGLLDSGFDAALADEIAAEFQTGNIKTTSELKQYLYDRYQNVALVDQLLGEQLKEYQNDAETVSKFIRSYKFGATDDTLALRDIISNGFKEIQETELKALSNLLQKPIDQVVELLGLEYNANSKSWQGKNFSYLVKERDELAKTTNFGNSGSEEDINRFRELNEIIHTLTTGSGLDFDEVLIASVQNLRDIQHTLEESFSDGIVSYDELKNITGGQQDAFIKAYEGVLFEYNESIRGYALKQGATLPSAEELEKYGISITSGDWARWTSLTLRGWKENLNSYIERGGKKLTIEEQGFAKLALQQGLNIKEGELGNFLNSDTLNIQALADLGYEAAVSYISNLTDNINDNFNSYFEDLTKVGFEDLTELYKNITGKEEVDPSIAKDYQKAIEEAKKGNTNLLSNILLNMVEEAQKYGYNIDVTTIQNTIRDAALSLMATIAGTFEAGIEGTMTNADYTQLLKDIGVNQFEADGSLSKDWEHWQNLVISTNEGLKFTKDGLTEVYNTVRAHNAMASQGILEMIADDLTQYKTLGSTLEYIQELRTKIQNTDKRDEDKIRQYEDELALAEKILRVRSQDPDQFNFMSRDIPDEIQSPLNVWQNAADAASALQDAKKNGYMGAEDFYRIVTTASEYMTAAGQEFSVAGMTYEDLISKATSSLATANGNLVVDFSKFGVDFAGGIDDMAGGLEEGLKALAEEQIKMLDAMIAMLETIKELDKLGDTIGNGDDIFEFDELFNFDASGNLTGINEQVQQWFTELQGIIGIIQVEGKSLSEAWSQGIITPEELMAFMNDFEKISYDQFATIEELIAHVQSLAQTHFGGSVEVKAVKDLQNVFEINSDGTVIFDGVTYATETEALKAYAAQDAALMGGDKPYEITSANGTKVQYKRDAELDIVYQVHTTEDGAQTYWYQGKEIKGTEAFQEALTTNDQEKLNEVLKESGIKSTEEISPVTTAKYGGINLEIGEKLFINGKEVESLDAWARETFEGVSKEEAEAIESQIEKEPYTIGSYSGINYQFEEDASVFVNGEIVTSLADYVKSTFEKVAENAEVQTGTTAESYYPGGSYSGLSYTFGDGVTVNGLVYASLAQYVQGLLATTMESLEGVAKIPTTVTVEADTDDAETDLQNVITKLQTIEKAKSRSVSVTASTSTAYNQLQAIINALKNINSKSITVTTTYTQVGNPPSNNNSDVDVISGAGATGNVALAKGRGTFMGELGPELYVQNGHYYIAGKNGPEFVDLQDDAIVFNHLQTRRIMSTGHAFGRGTPIVSERRSVALATGNAFGPAHANSSIDSAIEQLKTAREFWKGLLNQLSLSELMSGSGGHKGGGSGNSIKAVTEELQEWYNLSRQIADIEQDINNLLAERENIEWSNGEEYLKSLREQQKLLQQQMATQQALLDYQELQLQRQADHINQNSIWSQFLTVGEDGLLQYIEGNETNGGKGALQVLQELNQMSGEQQTAYLKSIGYSYTNNDGKKLEGQELVEQFFQELQDQIDQYDSLYDTVHGTQETLEELQTSINDINEQIKENQMELEEEIFDIIVESLEKEIEVLEEQVDLIEEANEAYINGLNEALSAERQMYDDNQKVADREQLQRQLSLLRRSGGSASEIANLEEQLNDMLKDEYFNNQERMIEDIRKANDLQVQQLQTQIKLQEDSLEYQKEHGIIWNEVYRVLSQSKDEILAFMQGNSTTFFSQSLLMQEQMLTDWAHKIGIYSEDKKYQNFAQHAQKNLWENGQAWNLGNLSQYQSTYNGLTDEEKNTIRDQFTSVYAQARLDGDTHEVAAEKAAEAVTKTLKRKQDANDAENNKPPTTDPNPDPDDDDNSGGNDGDSGGNSGGSTSTESPTHWTFTYNGKTRKCFSSKDRANNAIEEMYNSELNSLLATASDESERSAAHSTASIHRTKARNSLKSGKHANGYSKGGIVDYTGIAVVHGTPGKPESFLNAEQTAQIREGLKESGKGGALEGIKAALLKLDSSIKAVTNISNKMESNSYTIAPGAVVIQVEQLNDAYDVDTLSADIMNRMYAIGNKSTNRGVSRR